MKRTAVNPADFYQHFGRLLKELAVMRTRILPRLGLDKEHGFFS